MTPVTNADKARIIRKGMEIIATPETWCQGTYAKNEFGKNTFWYAPTACRWCALGACRLAAIQLAYCPRSMVGTTDLARELVTLEVDLFGPLVITLLNDTEGHTAVLAAMADRAAKLERTSK